MTDVSEVAGSYWVVIPAYNEAATVRDVAMRARQQCPNVIVVDDGSTDGTAEVLPAWTSPCCRNEQNLGKAGSLWRGFEHALARGAPGSSRWMRTASMPRKRFRCSSAAALHDPMPS